MLYPTLNQPLVIVVMLGVGFLSGVLLDVGKILAWITGEQKLARHFFDFLAVILSAGLVIFCNLRVNYGQFRIYVLLVFFVAFLIERFLSKILWTKLLERCYTNIVNIKHKLKKRGNRGGKKEGKT